MSSITFNPGLAYAEYNQRKAAYIIAAIVAFTMSSYFVVGYLAGNLLFWTWDISQTMNGAVGVGICFVMTAYQFILYSQGDIAGGRKATILAVCVAVGFSLLSEVGQGMERDHVRMESKSIESPTYQAVLGQIGNSSSAPNPYSDRLARAQVQLATCQKKVAAGIWSDCVESTARVAAVQSMVDNHYQRNQQRSIELASTAKAMEKDESNYHPLVNLIRSVVNSSGVVASFILSLILISFFEYAFHYLGRQLAYKRAELLSNGFDVTQRNRKVPNAFKVTEKETTLPGKTWNDELSKTGIDFPTDDVLNQSAEPEQIKRIVERGQHGTHAHVGTEEEQLKIQLNHDLHARVGSDEAYQHASGAPVGSEVACPQCGVLFKKRNQQHRFCKKQHRFDWHNARDNKRQEVLKGRGMQTA